MPVVKGMETKIVVFGVVLAGLVNLGSSIVCYECNSSIDGDCSNPIAHPEFKRNCSELDRGVTHVLCRKMVQHLEHEVNGRLPASRIIRTCGWDDSKYKNSCYHRAGYGGRQEVCSCQTNLCNSSNDVIPSTILVSCLLLLGKKVL